jgi:hypothetical protein
VTACGDSQGCKNLWQWLGVKRINLAVYRSLLVHLERRTSFSEPKAEMRPDEATLRSFVSLLLI